MSAALIARFGRSVTVTRKAAGSYNNKGEFVPGADSSLAITASIQPISARERELLPEGTRLKEVFKLYTTTQLLPPRGTPPAGGDTVSINGENYLVTSCQDYSVHQSPSNVIRFYKAQVERIEEGT